MRQKCYLVLSVRDLQRITEAAIATSLDRNRGYINPHDCIVLDSELFEDSKGELQIASYALIDSALQKYSTTP